MRLINPATEETVGSIEATTLEQTDEAIARGLDPDALDAFTAVKNVFQKHGGMMSERGVAARRCRPGAGVPQNTEA